jgi:hypothetical protein
MKFSEISLNRQFLFSQSSISLRSSLRVRSSVHVCLCVYLCMCLCVRACVHACVRAFTHECMPHLPILESRNIRFTRFIFQPEYFYPNHENLIYPTYALHQVHRQQCPKPPSLTLTTTRKSYIQVVDKKGTVMAGELEDLLDVSDPPAWHPESVAFAPSITLTGTQPTVRSQSIIDSQCYGSAYGIFLSCFPWLAVLLRLSNSSPTYDETLKSTPQTID